MSSFETMNCVNTGVERCEQLPIILITIVLFRRYSKYHVNAPHCGPVIDKIFPAVPGIFSKLLSTNYNYFNSVSKFEFQFHFTIKGRYTQDNVNALLRRHPVNRIDKRVGFYPPAFIELRPFLFHF
jgi:hypothetical protein